MAFRGSQFAQHDVQRNRRHNLTCWVPRLGGSAESRTEYGPECGSCDKWSVGDSGGAEHAPVTFDLGGRAERFGVVVGELDRRSAFDIGYLTNQADRVKPATAAGIAAAEIVGKQSTPPCTEPNTPARDPLSSIQEIGCSTEITDSRAARLSSTKIGM